MSFATLSPLKLMEEINYGNKLSKTMILRHTGVGWSREIIGTAKSTNPLDVQKLFSNIRKSLWYTYPQKVFTLLMSLDQNIFTFHHLREPWNPWMTMFPIFHDFEWGWTVFHNLELNVISWNVKLSLQDYDIILL